MMMKQEHKGIRKDLQEITQSIERLYAPHTQPKDTELLEIISLYIDLVLDRALLGKAPYTPNERDLVLEVIIHGLSKKEKAPLNVDVPQSTEQKKYEETPLRLYNRDIKEPRLSHMFIDYETGFVTTSDSHPEKYASHISPRETIKRDGDVAVDNGEDVGRKLIQGLIDLIIGYPNA